MDSFERQGDRESGTLRMRLRMGPGPATATRALLILTGVVYLLQLSLDALGDGRFTELFSLSRRGLGLGWIWQLGTYIFLHGGPWHLLINMLMLGIFGRDVEMSLGTRRFTLLYLGAGVLAGAGWVILSGNPFAQCVGASGAVFAVLAAFAGLFPQRQITLLLFFVLPVTMTARTMAISLGVMTVAMLFYGNQQVAHMAHLVGGVVGYLYGRRQARKLPWLNRGRGVDRSAPVWSRLRARWRRQRLRLAGEDESEARPETLDRLLDKIQQQGIGSLSRRERELLERMSREYGGSTSPGDEP